MTKSTSGGCDQFETSPEANDQELRIAFCERRQTDILKTNYRIDKNKRITDKDINICTLYHFTMCMYIEHHIMIIIMTTCMK